MKNSNRIWSIQSFQSLCGHCAHSLELSEQPTYMVSQSVAHNLGVVWRVNLRSERKVNYELRCSIQNGKDGSRSVLDYNNTLKAWLYLSSQP